MFRIYSLLLGFVLGHIQTAYILGKTVKKIDIREHGSGNAGMTNAARVMGGKVAVAVLLVDVIKAFAAYFICSAIFSGSGSFFTFGGGELGILPGLYGATGAILGHMFPVYMKFKGGRSVACGIGLILALDIRIATIILVIAMVVIFFTKYVSAASIESIILLPILILIFGYPLEAVLIGVFLAAIVTYKHKDNIKRILNGTENKVGSKKHAGR